MTGSLDGRRTGAQSPRYRYRARRPERSQQLQPAVHVELLVDAADDVLDRLRPQPEPLGDLAVAQARRQQAEDLLLAVREGRGEHGVILVAAAGHVAEERRDDARGARD